MSLTPAKLSLSSPPPQLSLHTCPLSLTHTNSVLLTVIFVSLSHARTLPLTHSLILSPNHTGTLCHRCTHSYRSPSLSSSVSLTHAHTLSLHFSLSFSFSLSVSVSYPLSHTYTHTHSYTLPSVSFSHTYPHLPYLLHMRANSLPSQSLFPQPSLRHKHFCVLSHNRTCLLSHNHLLSFSKSPPHILLLQSSFLSLPPQCLFLTLIAPHTQS